MRRLLVAMAVTAATATPAAAEIVCRNPDATVEIALVVEDRAVTRVDATAPHRTLSTAAKEEVFSDHVAVDRIAVMLSSPGVGPTTLFLDIVRLAAEDPAEGVDRSVSAGVAEVAGVGPVTLVCTGW